MAVAAKDDLIEQVLKLAAENPGKIGTVGKYHVYRYNKNSGTSEIVPGSGCLLGESLYNMNHPVSESLNSRSLNDLVSLGASAKEASWLQSVQDYQDDSYPWSASVVRANKICGVTHAI